MDPVAVLSVLVRAQGVGAVNAQLAGVQAMMVKTGGTATGMGATMAKSAKYGAAAFGVALAYGLAKAAQKSAQFEKRLDDLQAVSGANAKAMASMKKQALELGQSTKFGAMEVADAQVNLVKGGLAVKEVIGGALPAALTLAAAGDMELAEAARTTVNAMKLFDLQGKNSADIADMLSVAANKTTADVNDFAFALRQGGSVAKVAGYSLNEAVTVLEALAQAGIRNSDAGTSMKAAFIQLLSPSEQQLALQKKLNLEFVTQEGTLKSGIAISKMLRKELGNKTDAQRADYLSVLAGTDGFRTLSSLYAAGPAKLRAFSKANEKNGTAAEIARKKMDNLSGDTKKLGNSLEVAAIKAGDTFNPMLREVVQGLTGAVKGASNADFSGMFDSVKNTVGPEMNIGGNIDTGKLSAAVSNVGKGIKWATENVIVPALKVLGPMILNQLGGAIRAVSGILEILVGILTGDWRTALEGLKDYTLGLATVFTAPFVALWGVIDGPVLAALSAVMGVLTPVGQAFAAAGNWIADATSNIVGFVGSLLPVKVALAVIGTAAGVIWSHMAGQIGMVMPVMKGFANYIGILVKAVAGLLGPAIRFVGQVIRSIFVGAIRTGIAVLKVIWNAIKTFGIAIGNVVGIVSNLLRGDWAGAWRNAKELVLGIISGILSHFRGMFNVIKTVASSGISTVKVVVSGGFDAIKSMVRTVGTAIGDIFRNAWDTVKNVFKGGANAVIGFIGSVISVINLIPGIDDIEAPSKIGKQTGGPVRRQNGGIVPGVGSGDKFPMVGEAGAYVLNKKATEAYGLNRKLPHRRQEGGGVPLLLEPGERYFTPQEVKKAGRGRLEKMNRNVTRFQTGGSVPQKLIGGGIADAVGGAAGAVAGAAGDAIGMALKPADFFINKLPKPNLPGIFEGVGPWVIEKVTDWIKSKVGINVNGDPSDKVAYVTAVGKALQARGYTVGEQDAFGGRPTSGHADNSLHYQGRAIDVNADNFPGGEPAALDTLYAALQKIPHTELLWRVADHFDHLHYGLQAGGGVQKMLRGGAAEHAVVRELGRDLFSHGFDAKATYGVIGNAWREGLWNPGQLEYGNSSNGGLYGFTAYEKSLANLKEYAASINKPWNDATVQNHFMLKTGGMGLKGALNAKDSIAETADLFMREYERPDMSVSGIGERIAAGFDAMKILKSAGINEKNFSGSEDGMTDAQKAKAEKAKLKKSHLGQIEKLRAKIGEAKTPRGKKSAYFNLIEGYGKWGNFKKKEAIDTLQGVSKAAATPDPAGGIGTLARVAKMLKKNVGIEGIDGEKHMYDRIRNIRDRGMKRAEKKRKKINFKIGNRSMDYPLKKTLAKMKKALLIRDEDIARFEAEHATEWSPGGTDLSNIEIQKQIELNTDQLNRARGIRNRSVKSIDWLADYKDKMSAKLAATRDFIPKDHDQYAKWKEKRESLEQRQIDLKKLINGAKGPDKKKVPVWKKQLENIPDLIKHAANKEEQTAIRPGKDKWKAPGFREGIKNARSSIKDLRGDVIDMQGYSGKSGKILELMQKLDTLGHTTSFEQADKNANAAALADLYKEQARLSNLRLAVQERQWQVFKTLPNGAPFMGSFAGGGVAMVGERGPELVGLPNGSRVLPASETARIAQGGTETTVVINDYGNGNYEVEVDEKKIEAVVRKLNKKSARRVGSTPGIGGIK